MGKRIFAILLALVCLLPCAILPVSAEGEYQYAYDSNLGGLRLKGYTGAGGEIVIPSEIDGKMVVCVENVFKNVSLTKVTVPEGVRRLEETFDGQMTLKEVVLPKSLEEIYCFAFRNTGLRELILPEGLTTITIDAICNNANLRTLSIPASCKWVHTAGIYDNPALTKLTVASGNANYTTVANGALLMQKSSNEVVACAGGAVPKVLEVPNQVTHIRSCALSGCPNLETLILPESIGGMDGDVILNCPKFKTLYAKAPSFDMPPYAFRDRKGQVTVYCNAAPYMEPSENFTVKPYVSGMENEVLTTAAKTPTQAPAKTDSVAKPTETTVLPETTSEILSETTAVTETETISEIAANWSLRPDAATPNHRGAIIGGTVAGVLILSAGITVVILWKKGKLPNFKKK